MVLTTHGGGTSQRISLHDLAAANATGGVPLTHLTRLMSNDSTGFNMQILMEADAFSGPNATLSDVDFSFGGTAVN